MSTYAEVAATNADGTPQGMPAPKTVKKSSPSGSVEVVSEKVANELKEAVDPVVDKAAEFADKAKDKINDKDSVKKTIVKYIDAVKGKTVALLNSFGALTAQTYSTTVTELKNPVVSSQVILSTGIIGAIAAFSAGRIDVSKPNNKWVSIAVGAAAAGFVIADGFFVKKNYPKYKKA